MPRRISAMPVIGAIVHQPNQTAAPATPSRSTASGIKRQAQPVAAWSMAPWRSRSFVPLSDDATQVSDVGSVLFCLSEQKSELHLLDEVIVVLALVLRFGHPRQTG